MCRQIAAQMGAVGWLDGQIDRRMAGRMDGWMGCDVMQGAFFECVLLWVCVAATCVCGLGCICRIRVADRVLLATVVRYI